MFVLSLLSYCIQLCSINHCTIILLYYCHHPIIIYNYNYNLIPLSSLYNRIIRYIYIYTHYTDYIMTVLIYTYYTIYWLLVIDFIFMCLLIYNNCIGRMISHGYIMLYTDSQHDPKLALRGGNNCRFELQSLELRRAVVGQAPDHRRSGVNGVPNDGGDEEWWIPYPKKWWLNGVWMRVIWDSKHQLYPLGAPVRER